MEVEDDWTVMENNWAHKSSTLPPEYHKRDYFLKYPTPPNEPQGIERVIMDKHNNGLPRVDYPDSNKSDGFTKDVNGVPDAKPAPIIQVMETINGGFEGKTDSTSLFRKLLVSKKKQPDDAKQTKEDLSKIAHEVGLILNELQTLDNPGEFHLQNFMNVKHWGYTQIMG